MLSVIYKDLKLQIDPTIDTLNTLFGETTSGTLGGYRKELKLRSIKKITKTKKKVKQRRIKIKIKNLRKKHVNQNN